MVTEAFLIAISVLSLIPFADYLLDPSLINPNKFTKISIEILSHLNLSARLCKFCSHFYYFKFIKSNIFFVHKV